MVETKVERTPAGAPANSPAARKPQMPVIDVAPELDYTPKKMTPRETVMVSLKLFAITGAVFGLLWLAHVKLEK